MSVSEITETRQYLTFKLGNEIFATDVAKVREVLDLTTITAIPARRSSWPGSSTCAAAWFRWSI
jgi:chemotaxis signal transduction protein